MLRSLLVNYPAPIDLTQDEEVLFPDIQKYNSRETHYDQQNQVISPFISINQLSYRIRCNFQQLTGYENDKIKFMTKVQVDQSKQEGLCGKIDIVKEPIFSKNDVITFLLIFKWYCNAKKMNIGMRKSSFAPQKANQFRLQQNKNTNQQQELLHIVFLLSQKIYIEDRFIDQFINVVSQKKQIHYKQLNCLSILLLGVDSKRRIGNMASTEAQTNKFQHYSFDNLSLYNSMLQPQKRISSYNNGNYPNKCPRIMLKNSYSSYYFEKSPKVSITSRQNLEEGYMKNDIRFNLQRTKKYFSAIEYLTSRTEVTIQIIIMQLTQDKNPLEGGLHFQALQKILSLWPKYNNYGGIYELNKQKIMDDLVKRSIQNYRLMVFNQLQEIQNPNSDQIYLIINNFANKINAEFHQSSKEYINQIDYDSYMKKLEKQISKLQNQFLRIFAMIKQEYGSRAIENLYKQNFKNSGQNYLLMKVIGKQQLSHLDIGYSMYQKLIQPTLQQGFAQFLSKRYKGSAYGRQSANYNQDQLSNIQNRIQILKAKKKNLYLAIQLSQKDQEQLRAMLNLLNPPNRGNFAKSGLPIV